MPNITPNGTSAADSRTALAYFIAGLVALSCAGLLVGNRLQASAPAPAMNLQQAVSDFDAGNLTAATATFRKLADAGDPHAAYWYGHALDLGLGIPADPNAAIARYQKAWAGGVTPAATRLGELYLDGNALPPDFAKARSYLTDAARRGDARAAFDLGRASE